MTANEANNAAIQSASEGAGRLFRSYERHCGEPSPDTLFDLLNAAHSLNDRVQAAVNRDFHGIEEFIALKAIRNLAHHQEEVRANVRVLPTPGYSDLMMMCILRRDQVDRAIDAVRGRWQEGTRAACEAKFHWFGPAVNINPCLFNFVVKAYELLLELGVPLPEDAAALDASYRYEDENGHSHYVEGTINAHAGVISKLLDDVVSEMPAPA